VTQSHWQVQEAKQRFSELIRHARSDGAQFVTKHGAEVAVVLDIVEYRRLRGQSADFKEYLRQGPYTDDLDLLRVRELPRGADLTDVE
jgi:prevent-host-death family protein